MRHVLVSLAAMVVVVAWTSVAFGQQGIAYINCMKNKDALGPCAPQICGYQACIAQQTSTTIRGIPDPGAWGASMAACQPHIQIIEQCGEKLRQAGPSPHPGQRWTAHSVSDCTGRDVGSSNGATPQDSFCGPNTAGQVAVCWDGAAHKHPGRAGAWCTYKSVSATACRGGTAPGRVFVCNPQAR